MYAWGPPNKDLVGGPHAYIHIPDACQLRPDSALTGTGQLNNLIQLSRGSFAASVWGHVKQRFGMQIHPVNVIVPKKNQFPKDTTTWTCFTAGEKP